LDGFYLDTFDTRMQKRIVFVSYGKPGSVLSLRATCLSRELLLLGWDSTVLYAANEGPVGRQCLRMNIAGYATDLRKFYNQHPNSFYHFLNPTARALMSSLVCPRMKIIGDWEDWHCIERDTGFARILSKIIDRYMMLRSRGIITVSRWFKNYWSDRGRQNVCYIPYAIDPIAHQPGPNPFQAPTAVFMGNLSPPWDHDILFSALKLLQEQSSRVRVRVIGRGVQWPQWNEFVKANNLRNVELVGYLSDAEMQDNLRWAHLLLFPIRDKVANLARCPFKILQYAQAKRPILTSNVGEVGTFLKDRAVYLSSDPSEWAGRINSMMQEPRNDDIEYGIEKETWEQRAQVFDRFLLGLERQD